MLDLSSLEISGESLTTFAILKKWEMQKVKNFSPVSDNCLVEADELNTTVIFLLIECPRIYSTNQEPEPPKSRNSAWLLAHVLVLALSCPALCLEISWNLATLPLFKHIWCNFMLSRAWNPPKSQNSAWLLPLVIVLVLVLQSLEILQLCLSWYLV